MLVKKYGIYSPEDGKKLKNSDELLTDKNIFWHPITEQVLNSTPNDMFGILLHHISVNNKKCWIVRESKKWNLKFAAMWYSKDA